MRKLIPFFLLLICFSNACENKPTEKKLNSAKQLSARSSSNDKSKAVSSYAIHAYQTPNGWAYQISQNGKLLIDQPTVPGRAGTQGFRTEIDARNVANLVCNKLKAKIFPPTVSEDDLKNLNIH